MKPRDIRLSNYDHDESEKFKKLFCDRLQELGLVKSQIHPAPKHSTSTAALQGIFLYNKGNMQGAISMAELLVNSSDTDATGTTVLAAKIDSGG